MNRERARAVASALSCRWSPKRAEHPDHKMCRDHCIRTAVHALKAADDYDAASGYARVRIDDAMAEEIANTISRHQGMRFDGFWSTFDEMSDEDRQYALLQARAVVETIVRGGPYWQQPATGEDA